MADTVFAPRSFSRLLDEGLDRTKPGPHGPALRILLVMAVINTAYGGFTAAASSPLAGGMLSVSLLVGMLFFIPVVLLAQFAGYALLAILATDRITGREATLATAFRQFLTARVLAALVLCAFLVVLSFFALILPALIVSALLSFIVPVLLLERLGVLDSIARSASLAWRTPKGRLRTAPLVLVLAAHTTFISLNAGLTMALQLPLQIGLQYLAFRDALGGAGDSVAAMNTLLWLQAPLGGLGAMASGFCFYYLCHCLALYFLEVREAREAPSIETVVAGWRAPEAEPMAT